MHLCLGPLDLSNIAIICRGWSCLGFADMHLFMKILSESLMSLFAQGNLDEDEEGAVEDDEQLVAAVQAELTGLCV